MFLTKIGLDQNKGISAYVFVPLKISPFGRGLLVSFLVRELDWCFMPCLHGTTASATRVICPFQSLCCGNQNILSTPCANLTCGSRAVFSDTLIVFRGTPRFAPCVNSSFAVNVWISENLAQPWRNTLLCDVCLRRLKIDFIYSCRNRVVC